jgi:hypothetical protein
MGKDNNRSPYCKVPIPYIPGDEKEADPSDGKPPSVKILLGPPFLDYLVTH